MAIARAGPPDPAVHPGRGARRVGNLDVLRALSAIGILLVHAYAIGGRAAPIKAQHWYDVPLIGLASGVWLFFAISGYLISKPFVDRLLSGRPLPALVPYVLRRMLRVYPLYWIALTAVIAIDGTGSAPSWELAVHYALFNNLIPGRQEALLSTAWTLTVEVIFYTSIPLLALAASRLRSLTAERLAGLVLASWIASVAFTVLADLQGDGELGLWLRGSFLAMWQAFCPGMLLAIGPHLLRAPWRRWVVELPQRRAVAAVILTTLAVGALLSAIAPLRFGIVPYQLLVDVTRPIFSIGYGLLIAVALRVRTWGRHGRWMLELGLASYGIYLVHPVLESVLLRSGLAPVPHDTAIAYLVNATCLAGLTIPVALISWRLLEQPMIGLGRRLGERWRAPIPAVALARMPSRITPVSGEEISAAVTDVPVRAPERREEIGDARRAEEMKRFWNARAREDAFYFVDTRQAYRSPDRDRFWASADLVDHVLDGLEVRLRSTDTVLEIGCGLGRITRGLAARAGEVIALDVSDEMLARARELNPQLRRVRWILGDGVSLAPIRDESVDACVSIVVLQHVPDPAITLGYVREVGRVLRADGWAALQVSNDPSIHRPRGGRVLRCKALVGLAPRGQRHAAWLGSHVELPALRTAAQEASMELEKVWGEGSQYCQVLLRKQSGSKP